MPASASLWQRLRLRFARTDTASDRALGASPRGDAHSVQAAESLRALLDDPHIPTAVRSSLAADFARLEAMLGKLERGELHIAVFGRVSVGKSALANALLGEDAFAV